MPWDDFHVQYSRRMPDTFNRIKTDKPLSFAAELKPTYPRRLPDITDTWSFKHVWKISPWHIYILRIESTKPNQYQFQTWFLSEFGDVCRFEVGFVLVIPVWLVALPNKLAIARYFAVASHNISVRGKRVGSVSDKLSTYAYEINFFNFNTTSDRLPCPLHW